MGLFETTATVSAAFFVACLIVAQITVDRAERARLARVESESGEPRRRTSDVRPLSTYHAELLFAALVVAMLEFNAMLVSLVGLLPHHTVDADAGLTFALLQLGACAYFAPLFVLLDARTRTDALANLSKAVRVHDLSGIFYGLTAALMFVALAGGIALATGFAWTDFAWETSGRHDERLAWTSAFLIVSGGIAMALAMVIYFLTRPFEATEQSKPANSTQVLAVEERYAVLSVAVLLWITSLSLVVGAIVTFSLAFYVGEKWVIVAVALAAILATLRSTLFRGTPKAVLAILIPLAALVALLNNPIVPAPFTTHEQWVVPDLASAMVLFAAGLLLAIGARPVVAAAPQSADSSVVRG